jgi:spore germination protein YaaH
METSSVINRSLSQLARAALRLALAILLAAPGGTAAQKATPVPKPASAKAAPTADPALVRARWHVLGARPLAMFYYSNDSLGLEALRAHAQAMTLLSPQCFWIDRDGFVHGAVPADVLEAASRADLPVMPLAINPGFDRPTAHALLRNVKAQERAAMYLGYLAQRDHYLGWQLDLENIDPADKLHYTRFVERVAARLHRDRRLLSVAVVPRFSDAYPDNRPVEFRTGEWGAPFDFRALGRVADFLTLMAYDQHSTTSPPGPVAGYDWAKAALDYAVRRVPRTKLLLGIPLYGREWVETSQGATSRSLAYKDLEPYLGSNGSEPRWDERWRTTWFQMRDGEAQRTAWFDDYRSLREKLDLMQLYRLRGFAAWRLGVEDPQFWALAAQFEASRPQGARRALGAKKRERSARASGTGQLP